MIVMGHLANMYMDVGMWSQAEALLQRVLQASEQLTDGEEAGILDLKRMLAQV